MRVPDFFVFVKYRKFQNSKQIGLIAESRNEEKMSNCDSTNFWGVPVQASNVLSRLAHTCICFKDCLIVWGGYSNCFGEELYLYTDEIWIYHTKSGLWFVKKTEGDAPLQTSGATAILVHTDMYIFGGHQWHGHTNQLFKLDLLNLHWSKMYEEGQYEHLPSPRDKMAGWHYKHQLYFFGGFGFPTKGYMRKNGIYEKDVSVMSLGWNNQLIVFDLETQQWSDMPCKGSIPSPRAAYSADKIKNKVYLFGGRYKERRMNDFYCLDLDTLWWTELNSDGPVPTGRSWHTLTALSSNTLLLFGGFTQDQHPQDDAWIVNLRTVTWHELHGRTDLKPRLWHTAARNNEGDVYVFGGCQNNILQNNEPNIHSNEITVFRLNPHSLLRFLENYNGYYDWRKHKKAAPKLTSEQLKLHSSAIFNVVAMPFTSAWGSFKYDLENLSLCLNSYAVDYLDKANKEQQERQSQDHPVRQVEVDTFLSYIPPTEEIDSKYVILDQILSKLGMYEYLYFDDTLHVAETFRSRFDKYSFIANLKLSCPVNVLQYTPGGQSGKTVFLWKVPEGRAISILMQETMQVVHDLKPRLHEYHTRYMRREFSKKYCNLNAVTIPKHILRAMYAELTGDASIDQNPCMDERVRQAVLAEDPELVLDLRHLNKGRPGNTFDAFFEVLNAKVEEMCAADERRHGIEHFAKYISVKDLIEDVKNDLNPDAPVPSESTVLFSFTPKNSYLNSAKLYTARVPLQFKVQTRQLRLQHQDDHFCAAQFKYMRHFAVQFSDNVTFLSIDDKSKIDIGEPGQTVSTGVRGKKSIVPMGSSLSALDHDVSSKGSLTPSVCLKVEIPEEKDGSFYRGKVFVCYKDSIFQPSSPWRHAAEMTKILQMDDNVKPVLMIFSDGGPDHRLTYHSVKLSLIILFKNLDLDLLIAGRTAPGHSWLNPVERIMSTLNIALQNVALSRTECSSEIEQVLKSANCMADIRRKAEKVSGLKDAWISSLQGIVELLEERTQKVSLKGVPFECVEASSEEEVLAVEEKVVHVDQNIEIGKYHTKDLSKKRDYLTFLADHCIQRQYLFQIKKCQNVQCCKPRRCTLNLPNMPDPVLSADKQHYQNFEDLLGQATTDADRPSFSNQSVTAVAEALQGAKAKDLTGQNVRKIVTCVECGKPRCIYARKALTVRELRALVRLLEKYDYSCGSLITPDGDALQGIIFVRLQINCNSAIEFPYYSTDKCPTRKDLCCYCATEGAIKDEDLLKEFRVVLPMCRDCKLLGREAPKRNPINKK